MKSVSDADDVGSVAPIAIESTLNSAYVWSVDLVVVPYCQICRGSGTGSDGSLGIGAIKKMGGTVIAQDQESAEFFGMPAAAIKSGHADFILRLDEIPLALATLVAEGVVR